MMLSFVIPVYNNPHLTKACVDSLRRATGSYLTEIIIVDDGSSEATQRYLLSEVEKSDRFKVITHGENLGFARSINDGAAAAIGDFLFLLNNDLVFREGWLQPMVDGFVDTRVGLVGNVQIDARTAKVDHAGYWVDGDAVLRHKRNRNRFFGLGRATSRFAAVTGACCAIRRNLFHELGGLDETFRNGCEDIDLCFRVAERGLAVVVANKSEVLHYVGSTRGEQSLADEANSRHLQRKWRDRLAGLAMQRWPKTYLKQVLRNWDAFTWTIGKQALPRLFGLESSPAPAAQQIAHAKLDQNERHWRAVLDGCNDDQIKQEECEKHGQWMYNELVYEQLHTHKEGRDGRWIKESAFFRFPAGIPISSIVLTGEILAAMPERPAEKGRLGLRLLVDEAKTYVFWLEEGKFAVEPENTPCITAKGCRLEVQLLGVHQTNAFAYLGRVLRHRTFLPRSLRNYLKLFIPQWKNQRLLIHKVCPNGEEILDFTKFTRSPIVFDAIHKYGNMGVNLVGWFRAELGVGESVRLAAKALATTKIKVAHIDLKANCLSAQGETSMTDRLVKENPYAVNVFHIDAPQSPDIDHFHGPEFRQGKYNVAYLAWELPDFPDDWIQYLNYFDEVWTPSRFVADAISLKSPLPTVVIPHCIDFEKPGGNFRARFNLPTFKFLFLFVYDLNSYQERKNPAAVIEAFRRAFPGDQAEVGLVIKIHSTKNNPGEHRQLRDNLKGVANVYLIEETLPRVDVYGLMSAVDCYVSLHRAEGFGLTIAESMALGKPVIATDWSGTAEYLNRSNGCPVDCEVVTLRSSHGPYKKGNAWADPDIDHAAEHMRRLASDPKYAEQLGTQAAKDIQERFSPEVIGQIYEKRLIAIATWKRPPTPSSRG